MEFIKKNFGFDCMRLPMNGDEVDTTETCKMVDAFLEGLHGGSPASYALRFAAGFPGMMMVLSGMSNMEQMNDNISFVKDFQPLNETEVAAVAKEFEKA